MVGEENRNNLAELIEQARARARGPMTKEEWLAQRASFVRAETAMGSDADERAYRDRLVDEGGGDD